MSKKNRSKIMVVSLILLCLVTIGGIYHSMSSSTQQVVRKDKDSEQELAVLGITGDSDVKDVDKTDVLSPESLPVSEELTISKDYSEVIDVQPMANHVDSSSSEAVDDVKIQVDIPKVPENPVSTPPEFTPVTTSDVSNIDQEPLYTEEALVTVPEATNKDDVAKQEIVSVPSALVPASENPFLQPNIPSNGDGGEVKLEQITEFVPGTGDKF